MTNNKLHDVRTLPGGSVIITNPSHDILYLATAKQAVKAEAIGMRLTRGPKITPIICKRFGLKRSTPTADILARIDAELATVREQIAALNAGSDEARG